MSLEDNIEKCARSLEKIADALELVTANLTNGSVAPAQPVAEAAPAKPRGRPAKPAEPAAPAAAPQPTLDDLIDALKNYVRQSKEHATKAREILAGVGAAKISEVKPEDMAAVLKQLKDGTKA